MLPHATEIRREVVRIVVHAVGVVLSVPFIVYAAISWRDHGFPISVGHYVLPWDDGSFWALVIGLVLLVYCCCAIVRAATDARDMAHDDDDGDQRI